MPNVPGTNASETIDAMDGVTDGADTIYGKGGNDTIFGLGGNDMIKGGGGADAINGGSGSDSVNYTDSTEGVYVSLTDAEGFYGTAAGDTFISVEHIYGSYHGDALTGHDGDNILYGLSGNDVLKGAAGSDTLYGGEGDDVLQGGADGDVLDGGDGSDTIDYSNSPGAVFVNLVTDTVAWNYAQGDTIVSIENAKGSAYDDILWGDSGANVFHGGDGHDDFVANQGDDTLFGGAGNDDLNGGAGEDHMVGGTGNDVYWVDTLNDEVIEVAGEGTDEVHTTYSIEIPDYVESLYLEGGANLTAVGNDLVNYIVGNFGNNLLDGGAGGDVLTGGAGRDTFIFVPGNANGDLVVDFDGQGAAAGDTILLSGYGAGASFNHIDDTHWHVVYNGGASVDVITFLNGGANNVHPFDYSFI